MMAPGWQHFRWIWTVAHFVPYHPVFFGWEGRGTSSSSLELERSTAAAAVAPIAGVGCSLPSLRLSTSSNPKEENSWMFKLFSDGEKFLTLMWACVCTHNSIAAKTILFPRSERVLLLVPYSRKLKLQEINAEIDFSALISGTLILGNVNFGDLNLRWC